MKAFLASVAIVLAAGPIVAASPQEAAAPVAAASPQEAAGPTTIAVAHSPVACMIAGTYPQLEAGITPEAQVRVGRVYFHSALGDSFYYVEMKPSAGRYVGVLPRPRLEAGPITYYVEGVGFDFGQGQTPEVRSAVVEKVEDCKDRPLAGLGPAGPVRVFSVAGGTALPPGFSGVSSVVAGATTAGTTTAAAASGGISGTTLAIVGGAVVVGVGTIVIVEQGNPPASPSR